MINNLMVNQTLHDKYVLYNDPDSMRKLYQILDSNLKHFNWSYYLIANKIAPLNKMKQFDKITIKQTKNTFCFQVDTQSLTQPVIRWFNGQSRSKFFNKFFMIINYYYKKCLQIEKINISYPKVFSSVCKMYLNLGENLIGLLNTLEITYNQDKQILEQIYSYKHKISNGKQILGF